MGLRIGYIYNELQLIECLKFGLWSTNSKYKYFKKDDLIVFVTQETYVGFVAIAKFIGEPFESEERIWKDHNLKYRYPMEFQYIIPLEERAKINKVVLKMLGLGTGLVLSQERIEDIYDQKSIKPNSKVRFILEEFEKKTNKLQFYQENLDELFEEASHRPEMHWDGNTVLKVSEDKWTKFPLGNFRYEPNRINTRNYDIKKIIEEDIDAEEAQEDRYYKDGAVIKFYGNRFERNPKNRERAIAYHGFTCVACEFNFEETYGERGKEFIEIHHIKPLNSLEEEMEIDPEKDLVPVCSNCHSMIHRSKDEVLTIEQLKKILYENKKLNCKKAL